MEKQKNIPKLRFHEYTGEWIKKELGDVTKISSGGTPSRTKPDYWDGNIPWVSTTLIDFNTIFETIEYITPEGLRNSSAKFFPIGTLLMALYGQGKTRGKVALLGIEATTNQACGAITPNTKTINEVFLFQNLAGRYDEIRNLSNQGGQENLSSELIKRLSIVFPTLPEQSKIATFLTSFNDRLNQLKHKKNLLEQYKKGVMQKIFDQEIRFKDEDGKEFPEWEDKMLSEITDYVDYRGKTPVKTDYGVFLVTAKNIKQGYIDYDASKEYISEEDYDEVMRRGKPKLGDVLITTEAPLGNVASIDREEVALAQRVIKFRGKVNVLQNSFLKHCLMSSCFQKEIDEKSSGSTAKGIKGSELHKIQISFPCIAEQTKIANFLTAIDEKIYGCSKQIEKTEVYKKGLLQQMFV